MASEAPGERRLSPAEPPRGRRFADPRGTFPEFEEGGWLEDFQGLRWADLSSGFKLSFQEDEGSGSAFRILSLNFEGFPKFSYDTGPERTSNFQLLEARIRSRRFGYSLLGKRDRRMPDFAAKAGFGNKMFNPVSCARSYKFGALLASGEIE